MIDALFDVLNIALAVFNVAMWNAMRGVDKPWGENHEQLNRLTWAFMCVLAANINRDGLVLAYVQTAGFLVWMIPHGNWFDLGRAHGNRWWDAAAMMGVGLGRGVILFLPYCLENTWPLWPLPAVNWWLLGGYALVSASVGLAVLVAAWIASDKYGYSIANPIQKWDLGWGGVVGLLLAWR